jgi:Alw26I/Eco31I/Esp3I family type II restriction m6 adenine DNA methyltransferase
MPTDIAEWRGAEIAGQDLAMRLHRAAAIDLSQLPELWPTIPTNGLVRDLLAARAQSPVPSIHLSSSAGGLAVLAVLVEMGERRGSRAIGWRGDSLEDAARVMSEAAPELLGGHIAGLATQLPHLGRARSLLAAPDDAELAHLAGRVLESALSCYWVFDGSGRERPQPHRNPWLAKQQGCFFTPRFVARHMARQALRRDPSSVLDPALGAGALLIEAFLILEPKLGSDEALRRLHGVEVDAGLAELAALVMSFLGHRWTERRPEILGSQIVHGDALLAPKEGEESWRTWFPTVFAEHGGFGAAVMNPPYGQLKVNQSSLPSRPQDDPAMDSIREKALVEARGRATSVASVLRGHPDYRFAHGGVPDLPRFFMERALALLHPGGRLACIVPSTFLADHRSREFRRHLIEENGVREIDLIPENARMFPDVNQPTCVLVVDARGKPSKMRLRRSVRSAAGLRARPDVSIDPQLIRAIDPEELRVPNCTADELTTLRRMHRHPRLGSHGWIVNLRGEFDLTINAEHLRTAAPGHRLIRGSHIERYRSDLVSAKAAWVDDAFVREAISPQKARFVDGSRIVTRQCSYLRKRRRISATIVEAGAVVSNSCNFLAVQAPPGGDLDAAEAQLFLLGVLNSSIIDWRFSVTSSTNHVGNYELAALPIPLPAGRPEARTVISATRRLLEDPTDDAVDGELELAVMALYELPAAG